MNLHLHDLRKSFAWIAGGALVLGPMALAFGEYPDPWAVEARAPVSGRVTIHGQPVHDAIICFDAEGGSHAGFCSVWPDGSYQLASVCLGEGVPPGRYKVHIYPRSDAFGVPKQYQLPETSGIEVQVAPDWNELNLDLE